MLTSTPQDPSSSVAIDTVPAESPELRLGRSVSIDSAAQLLNVSRRTIYNMIRDGRVQTVRTIGGSQRVLVESLHDQGFRSQAFPTSSAATTFHSRAINQN